MLYLIGLGLKGDLTLEGFQIAQTCQLYLESYTTFLTVSVKDLEKTLQKKITLLRREEVEETQEFLKGSHKRDVALLVGGDPLIATTHTEILIEAKTRGIKTRIIHNSSIYSAIAETGLQIYKFGRTVTIPFPQKGFRPTSFYDIIQQNRENGAHTLVLLDIQEETNRYMNPKEALDILQSLGFREPLLCVSRLGAPDQHIIYGAIDDLLALREEFWGLPPHCVVVPGLLHFKEEEFLQKFWTRVIL